MQNEKRYTVWVADLNSLYDEQPRPPVVHERYINLWAAEACKLNLQNHATAAWVTDGDNGPVVTLATEALRKEN